MDNISQEEMVLIEVCQNELRKCPNVLIKTSDWQQAIENWLRNEEISERLRGRIKRKILYHDKMRISISGCPNACSRPQIADIGLVGFLRPSVEPEECMACGACERACPDSAITVNDNPPVFEYSSCQGCLRCRNSCPTDCIKLSRPGVRVLFGGKLGRHPRLAKVFGERYEIGEVIRLLDLATSGYIENAKADERFADYIIRAIDAKEFSYE